MPLHHYLPATYLGEFSNETTAPRRKRSITAGDRTNLKIFQSSAAKLARVRNLYTLVKGSKNPELIDEIWSDYESHLAEAIARLINGSIDALTWARTLIPFVACLLVRGPDFGIRFSARLRELDFDISKDNVNNARVFELQRLLGPVAAAEWIVSEVRGEGHLITNDLGFVLFASAKTGEIGMAVPLGCRHVLQLIPKRRRRIIVAQEGEWIPRIRYYDLEQNNHVGLNRAVGQNAQRFIFGPDMTTVRLYLYQTDTAPTVPEPYHLGFITGPLAVVHEFTWHRLISLLSKHPDSEEAHLFDIDWKAISEGWAPPVHFPANLPDFAPALSRNGNVIEVNFYEVPGFTN